MADDTHIVLSDTSWPGYEEVPLHVIDGYATIFHEIAEPVDVALIPIGVGAPAAAAARHYAPAGTRLIGVEPQGAACLLESVRRGGSPRCPAPTRRSCPAWNAGLPSLVAWPDVSAGFDAFCAVDDQVAIDGMRALAGLGVRAGEVSGGTAGAARPGSSTTPARRCWSC